MNRALSLIMSLSLVLFFAGCGKKPKVEEQIKTPPTKTEQKQDTSTKETPETTPEVKQEITEKFTTVYFDFDKYNLRDDAKGGIRQNVKVMQDNANEKVQVEGHCDERGTVEYNLVLGERRAKSVRDYMVSLGISAGRLSTISYGKERPAVMGSDEEAWAKNRRAEFVVK